MRRTSRSPWPQLLAAAIVFLCSVTARAQMPAPAFDVASVRRDVSSTEDVSTNVPLGPGNVYSPTGGLFLAKNFPLISYIMFAWRMTDGQASAFRAAAPGWVSTERFDISARSENTAVTKEELRLMMRSLLADRFELKVHVEQRDQSIYELTVDRPGSVGPSLRPHPHDASCPSTLPPNSRDETSRPEVTDDGCPSTCGGLVRLPTSDAEHVVLGGRNVPIALMANSLAGWGALGRTVVDRTGLTGTYDFRLDYIPQGSLDANPALSGPNFQQALLHQLGLRLVSRKAPVELIILDHIDPLKEN